MEQLYEFCLCEVPKIFILCDMVLQIFHWISQKSFNLVKLDYSTVLYVISKVPGLLLLYISILKCVYRTNSRCVLMLFFLSLDCLDSFTKVEELQESEQYFCPRCKKRQISTKKLTIQRLPNVSGNNSTPNKRG